MLCFNVMAAVTTLWLLTIMMVGWCLSFKDASIRQSPPECHRPCFDGVCSDINCTWSPLPGAGNNVTYTLHWEGNQKKVEGHWTIIPRLQFSEHSKLTVFIESEDKEGRVFKSQSVTFNTADIYKPSPPKINSYKPIEIHWKSSCEEYDFQVAPCDIRYRTEEQPRWFHVLIQEGEGGVSGSHSLNHPEPCVDYFFQVRCKCVTSLMSDWSEVYKVSSAERDPLGIVDVWKDCGILPQSSECVLMWKKLPISKACGKILGYNLELFFNNGTNALVALNYFDVHLVCNDIQCYYNSSLKNVKSVRINTYNAHGLSASSHVDMQVPVISPKGRKAAVFLEMNENNLTVAWNAESWISDIKEFVVQYKEAGSSLGQGLDWQRLNASLTKVTINGYFKKFTAYQVSVFTEKDHNQLQLFCTDVAHYVQGIPAEVPLFRVLSYDTAHATLLWEPVMMSVQGGVTPYYQVGYSKENVYNVSAYPQLENKTVTLDNLEENRKYEVWIKAVNEAGPGPNKTVRFHTLSRESTETVIKFVVAFGTVVLILILFLLFCYWDNTKHSPSILSSFLEKVPGPHKSNIFSGMKDQKKDYLTCPFSKDHPEISEIEIVKTSSIALIPPKQTVDIIYENDKELPEDAIKKEHMTQSGCSKQEYSKMIDTDDEKNEEDETGECSSSSEEDTGGYEQHFMPTDLDLQATEEKDPTEKICEE